MTPAQPERQSACAVPWLAVTLLSAAVIAFQVDLMRRLLIERWHHFGFLVISAALLGFGVSGTLLALFAPRVHRAPRHAVWWLTAAFLATVLVTPRLAAALPVTARFIPQDIPAQAAWWALYWLLTLLPFLFGGGGIGAALMTAGPHVGRTYAANLVGSALGAVGAALGLTRLPLELSAVAVTVVALLALAATTKQLRRRHWALLIAFVITATLTESFWPLPPRYDEHKAAAHIEQLTHQGTAHRVARVCDPHGFVEIYASDLFHDLPFLALHHRPPAMLSVLINGNPAGSILRIASPDEARVMDDTLMALPYRLLPDAPRVLLVGEVGGANVWLARRQNAQQIDVVQPNAGLLDLLSAAGPLAADAGHVFDAPNVHLHATAPRRFFTQYPAPRYDLIQLVALEGLAAGTSGLHGLAEDHLVTVEGLAAALHSLSDAGILAVSRGLQTPPRENVRLLATLAEAFESLGITNPERHLVQVRDYLGVCTLALRTPLDDARRTALRNAITALNLTPVWYPDLPPDEANRPDAMPGPPGSQADWLHHAARQIFSSQRESLYDDWLLNVRPPRDDRPFFWDFYRPAAIAALRQAYGPLWLTRAELGRLFLYLSLAISLAAALVLILLPLALATTLRRHRRPIPLRRALWTLLYFTTIGLGFMGIEMALISRAIHFLGDPVLGTAAVIGALLLLSGAGSATALRWRTRPWLSPLAITLLALLLWSGWLDALRAPALAFIAAGLMAVLMGIPMPTGLRTLDRTTPALIPWAWGINGVAGVTATSAAIALAMHAGYGTVLLIAAALYASAGILLARIREQSA